MKIIKRIVSDIRKGDNIHLYVFAFAAFELAILHALDLAPQRLVESAIVALLGVLVAYSLGIRDRLHQIYEQTSEARKQLHHEFPPHLKEAIASSSELLIVGITLNRTITTLYSQLGQNLKQGQRLKILMLQPYSAASKLSLQRGYRPISDKQLSDKILETIAMVGNLQLLAPGRVEVRTIDFPIPFGGFAADLGLNRGSIYLEYFSYKTPVDLPCVVISASEDAYWFDVYQTELLNMWNAAQVWDYPAKRGSDQPLATTDPLPRNRP
jgi:hypothetical protein